MKTHSLAFVTAILLTSPSIAREYIGAANTQKDLAPLARTTAGCIPATGQTELSINNVRTLIRTSGDMWNENRQPRYEVPKGSGKMALFAGALWLGGEDVNGQLRLAALRFRSEGNDYWAGPLSKSNASISSETCIEYDRHFPISRAEVEEFVAWWNTPASEQSKLFPGYRIPRSIMDWPAHGRDYEPYNEDYYLAPFYDNDPDGTGPNGIYDPVNDGDFPWYPIKGDYDCKARRTRVPLYGDKTLWWVFNDKGDIHTETRGDAIGMEIRAQAFSFNTNDEINNMTFYNYELHNRSSYRLANTYFGIWVDPDLGDPLDDYIGCDVMRGLGYAYNGKEIDGSGGQFHYGANPPAIGVDFFEGPYQDNDTLDNKAGTGPKEALNGLGYGDGIMDNERFGMRRFLYHNNSSDKLGDPIVASDYYNYLRGIWKDGSKMLYGGNGHLSGGGDPTQTADFMFPGDTDPQGWGTGRNTKPAWTEQIAGNQPGDRRFIHSAGPFKLDPGEVNDITFGVVYARASSGGPFASVELLKKVDDKAQALFENCFKVLDGPDAPDVTIREMDKELLFYLSNKILSNNYKEKYEEPDPTIITPQVLNGDTLKEPWDNSYNFQGYQVFQLADNTVGPDALNDVDKARLIFQCDVADGVSRLVNFEFDESLGFSVPSEMVRGKNEGIAHTFRLENDEFARGNRRLINHKKYYYMAVAYGHNNYLTYTQDPSDKNGLFGQQKPYKAGRKNIKIYTAIPHNPAPENEGTLYKTTYGDMPQITRLEGKGNGGYTIDLTQESVEAILNSPTHSMQQITYQQNRGPVQIKIVDPLNVPAADFKLYVEGKSSNVDSSFTWRLVNLENGQQVKSDATIGIRNEQLILKWGLSVTLAQCAEPGTEVNNGSGFIESSITYDDPSKNWFGGVPDIDGTSPFNWIRSGRTQKSTGSSDPDDDANICVGPANPCEKIFTDPNQDYEKILGGIIAPYKLASRKNADDGPGIDLSQVWNRVSMQDLASVDIVLTPDKSKWTRCPVLEMQKDKNLANNTSKFQVKPMKSVDKNGCSTCSDSDYDGLGTGMGWFPGYAINVETGERLNIAFGEDSWLTGDNGNDMLFNPTSQYIDPNSGASIFGGRHYFYIFGHNGNTANDVPAYDEGRYLRGRLETAGSTGKIFSFSDAMWCGIPMAAKGQEWLSCEAKIRLRVNKAYHKNHAVDGSATPENNNFPLYSFSTIGLESERRNKSVAVNALDLIGVTPNPYYGQSAYETGQIDTRIKIINLPQRCDVSIYTMNGTLVRQYKKDSPLTSLDWNLQNQAGIPVASGVYLIHIKADGVGEKVLKWFGIIREPDFNSF